MITEETNVFAQGLPYWVAHAANLPPLCFRSDVGLLPSADLARFCSGWLDLRGYRQVLCNSIDSSNGVAEGHGIEGRKRRDGPLMAAPPPGASEPALGNTYNIQ